MMNDYSGHFYRTHSVGLGRKCFNTPNMGDIGGRHGTSAVLLAWLRNGAIE